MHKQEKYAGASLFFVSGFSNISQQPFEELKGPLSVSHYGHFELSVWLFHLIKGLHWECFSDVFGILDGRFHLTHRMSMFFMSCFFISFNTSHYTPVYSGNVQHTGTSEWVISFSKLPDAPP